MTEFTILGRTFNIYEILRLVTIVGAYLLFRPYLLRLTQKFQDRDHARPVASGDENSSPAAIGDSASKSVLAQDEDNDEEEGSDGEDMSWGAKARRRKRAEKKVLKQLIDDEERRRAEEESDEEIAEFLDKDA